MKYCFSIIFILPLFITKAGAQDTSSKKSSVKFNVNYLSNAVYFARKDSFSVPYLRSSLTYTDKSGFYIGGGVSMLVNGDEPARLDMVNLDGGYGFSKGKLDGGVYLSKFFYSNASFAVGSELKGIAGVYAGYNLGAISIGGGGDLLFSTGTDINANLNVSHEFESGEPNMHWTFAPQIQANAGTQYFNEAYYVYRKFTFPVTSGNSGSGSSGNSGNGSGNSGKGSGKGHSNSGSSSTTTTTVKTLTFKDRNQFTVLDIELSVPVNYETKHWGAFANPVVAFPINPATYVLDNSIQKEKLSTVFFTEIGIFLKF